MKGLDTYLDWQDGGKLCTAYSNEGERVTGHVAIEDCIIGYDGDEIPIIEIVEDGGARHAACEFDYFLLNDRAQK